MPRHSSRPNIGIAMGGRGSDVARESSSLVLLSGLAPRYSDSIKKKDALSLGADEVVVSRNADEMEKHACSFDFILDTVSANHDLDAYVNLLGRDGNLTLVGAPEKPLLNSKCL